MLTHIEKQYTKLTVDTAVPAARITLSNPPINIIDLTTMDELLSAIEMLEQRADISFVILTGSERAFSAGVDIGAHGPEQVQQMLTKFHAVIRAVANSSKVTIAQVRGACMGGGAELALVCDLIYCSEDSMWQFPEINLACFPPVATAMLTQIVGTKRAAEMILTGQVIHGDEAFHFGLTNDAVPARELDELLDEVAARLASLSPAALAVTKKAIRKVCAHELDEQLRELESIYVNELMKTEDAREGVEAYLQKRRPVWKGK